MTDDQTEVIQHAVRAGRDPRWRRRLRAKLAWLALSVITLGVVVALQYGTTSGLRDDLTVLKGKQAVAADAAQQLEAQVRQLGGTPVVQAPAAVVGPTGQQGVAGPGPSQAEIDGAVSRYFAVHPLPPGQLPPVAEVATLVAQYLTAHPPTPGQDATPQMVSDAVVSYCGAHNGCAGPAGANATDDQVAGQVAQFCAAHDDCQGPAGTDGHNGADGTNGQPPASWVTTHTDGSTETCTRSPDFDATNPTYDCTDSAATPTTTTSPPSGGLLDLGGH